MPANKFTPPQSQTRPSQHGKNYGICHYLTMSIAVLFIIFLLMCYCFTCYYVKHQPVSMHQFWWLQSSSLSILGKLLLDDHANSKVKNRCSELLPNIFFAKVWFYGHCLYLSMPSSSAGGEPLTMPHTPQTPLWNEGSCITIAVQHILVGRPAMISSHSF